MRTLAATELLDIWERGEHQHPLDRALSLLEATCPEKQYPELVRLSIGQRDALLLSLRELYFGTEMAAFVACPKCGAQLEFTVNIEDLLRDNIPVLRDELTIRLKDYDIKFRLPDSADMAEIVNSSPPEAGKELLKRCILEVALSGSKADVGRLPDELLSELSETIAKSDPLAEVNIVLKCAECGAQFTEVLDILSYLWLELSTQAKGLLNQVHLLARYYGWRESDILTMKPWRRQYYADMITNG